MSPRVPKLRRRVIRWVVPGAVIALAPKCVLCVAAYFGLGTTLGWTGVELCGAPDAESAHGVAWLVVAGVALGSGALAVRRWRAVRRWAVRR